jgi:hypothetical protein
MAQEDDMKSITGAILGLLLLCVSANAYASIPTSYMFRLYDPTYGLHTVYPYYYMDCGDDCEVYRVRICPDHVDDSVKMYWYVYKNGTSFYSAQMFEDYPYSEVFAGYTNYTTYVRLYSDYGLDLAWSQLEYIASYTATGDGTYYQLWLQVILDDNEC